MRFSAVELSGSTHAALINDAGFITKKILYKGAVDGNI
jgi:hypothetical protein